MTILPQDQAFSYKAVRVDATTWMVKRFWTQEGMEKWDESLICGMLDDDTEEVVTGVAVLRGSWA